MLIINVDYKKLIINVDYKEFLLLLLTHYTINKLSKECERIETSPLTLLHISIELSDDWFPYAAHNLYRYTVLNPISNFLDNKGFVISNTGRIIQLITKPNFPGNHIKVVFVRKAF